MCHFLLWRPPLGYNICLIKGHACFSDAFICDRQFCYYSFNQGQSPESVTLPPPCSAIINSNQWGEELLWLKEMTWALLSLWKPRFSETHAESVAHCSVEGSLLCQSFPTLTSWHSEKQLRFCAVWTWCCFGHWTAPVEYISHFPAFAFSHTCREHTAYQATCVPALPCWNHPLPLPALQRVASCSK